MSSERRQKRQATLLARKAARKARLAEPVKPPTVPVALPWRRRSSLIAARRRTLSDGSVWSSVVSGDADDVRGSEAAAAAFVLGLGDLLGGRGK